MEKQRSAQGPAQLDLSMTGEQAFLNRSRKSREAASSEKAKKMMEKMGWKGTGGLGKDEQGIATPLIAKKTSQSGGKIVQSEAPTTAAEQLL